MEEMHSLISAVNSLSIVVEKHAIVRFSDN